MIDICIHSQSAYNSNQPHNLHILDRLKVSKAHPIAVLQKMELNADNTAMPLAANYWQLLCFSLTPRHIHNDNDSRENVMPFKIRPFLAQFKCANE